MNHVLLTISAYLIALLCIVIGTYPLLYARKRSLAALYFAAFSYVTGLWVVVFYYSTLNVEIFIVRVNMALAVLQVLTLWLFAYTFAGFKRKNFVIAGSIIGLLITAYCMTPFVFDRVVNFGEVRLPEVGAGMWLFQTYVVCFVGSAFGLFLYSWRRYESLARLQAMYITLGFLTTMAITIFCDFIAVIVWHTNALFYYGMFSVIAFVLAGAYAMTRYRFLDVKITFQKSSLYRLLIVGSILLYGSITAILIHWIPASMLAFGIILFTLIYASLCLSVAVYARPWFDQLFFREEIDTVKVVSDLPTINNPAHDLILYTEQLAGELQTMTGLSVSMIAVYQPHLKCLKNFLPGGIDHIFSMEDPLIAECRQLKLKTDLRSSNISPSPMVQVFLDQHRLGFCFPIFTGDTLMGLIFFAARSEGGSFDEGTLQSQHDIIAERLTALVRWQSALESTRHAWQMQV